ncbi:MAG: Nif3-like dinuclear metal center hexameric protein, partial [Clostridia bacterium]|nr:Nif3-like dinuclear metal center hexameric protein [Clostridia bacterium]
MKYSQLYSELERIIPRGLSCDWDNDGDMLCLDGERDIKKVLVTLDITLSAIEYAKNGGYDLIVSHHPLIFKPLRAINENGISAR